MDKDGSASAPFSLHYQFSKSFRMSMFFGTVLFLVLSFTTIYYGLFDRQTPNQNAPFVIGLALLFLSFAVYCILIIPRLYANIIIYEDRIMQQFKNGSSVFIRWEDISKITLRHYFLRIEIVSTDQEKVIFIERQIQGYEEIVDIIGAKLKKAGRKPPISHRFP